MAFVWVAETDRTDLRASNLKSDEMTLVFEGNVPVKTTDKEWTIQFPEGYEYKGGTLAIMVFKDAPGTQFEGVTFRGDYCYDNANAPLRTRFDSPWDETETIDHNALFGWDVEKHLPMTKLLFLPSAGVEGVVVDESNAPEEYYNLQGLKVAKPSNGIFIKVQGGKVSKEYVK